MTRLGSYLSETSLWLALIVPVLVLACVARVGEPSPQTILLAAAQSGDVRDVQTALADGSGVDIVDDVGFTPLMIAARAGHADAVAHLLDRGAKIDAQTPACGTALMLAALYGQEDVVTLLLAHHANPNCHSDRGQTALWYAVTQEYTSPAIIRQLIAAGADPDAHCYDGDTPRNAVVQRHDPAITAAMLPPIALPSAVTHR